MAVQLALQLGMDQRDRRSRASCSRDQIGQRRPRTAQVLRGAVHNRLRVGHVMNRRNRTVLNADPFEQDLHHRCKTVRRAACRCHNLVGALITGQTLRNYTKLAAALLTGQPCTYYDPATLSMKRVALHPYLHEQIAQ